MPKEKRISADEFFAVTPEDNMKHVELLDGIIVDFATPSLQHQDITGGFYREISNFIRSNNGICKPYISPSDVKLDDYNVVQPDVYVVCDPTKLSDGKRCNGAPDMVIEVTSTNRKHDYIKKLNLYCDFGVKEYWIVDPKYKRVRTCLHKLKSA